ncbi:MAG: hypothetical protein ACXQS8_09115, partial [Candidatus Helarchaeales archaeon]
MGGILKTKRNEQEKSIYKNLLLSLIDLMYFVKYLQPETQKYRRELTTKMGKKITFRPLSPKDDQKILEFYNNLSLETVYFRFFSSKKTANLKLIRKY